MSVELRPIGDAEYADWRARVEADYAQDMIDAGVDAEEARKKAERDFPALLPDGAATEGQDLYSVVDDGESVGVLWLCERDLDGGRGLFVYDVRIDAERRGHGYGRAAMELAEAEAKRRGLSRVALNVFGGNDVARNLYRSLGYTETAIFMMKVV
ncbi:MAG TPA: GNAT family N-acetyltransferase [Gaiellaceae bacterium]|nr:GNAT family N-acetyltransferase [Gaiellaceae bacterium]